MPKSDGKQEKMRNEMKDKEKEWDWIIIGNKQKFEVLSVILKVLKNTR